MTLSRRAFTLGVVLAALSAFPASGAMAQGASECAPPSGRGPNYAPAAVCGLRSANSSAAPGGTVRIQGNGFQPNSALQLILRSDPVTLGSTTSDALGEFNVVLTIPANTPPGNHTLSAEGINPSGSPRVLSMALVVAPAVAVSAAGTADALPRTGTSSVPLVVGAVLFLGVGAFLLVAARKRRRPAAA